MAAFAGEARGPDWLSYSYVVPDILNDLAMSRCLTSIGITPRMDPCAFGEPQQPQAVSTPLEGLH